MCTLHIGIINIVFIKIDLPRRDHIRLSKIQNLSVYENVYSEDDIDFPDLAANISVFWRENTIVM